ncbi:hypothetical protein V2J09_007582, partial [Rumex salicifolius]
LFKETSLKGCQNPQTAAVLGNVSSYFPTADLACEDICEILQMLYKMQCDIRDMDISLSKGESVEEQKHEVLRLKSDVVHQLELLFMDIKEKTGVESMDVESLDSEYYDDDEDEMISSPVPRKDPVLNMDELRWSSMNEPNEKERYLCLSNGYEIWCLDLSKFPSYPPKLPKVDTLSLLGSQLPASVGLFKLGSDAFMIGGQLLPASLLDPSVTSHKRFSSLNNPKGIALYKSLLASHGIKRSSHVTYSLSLAADNKQDGTLSLSHTKTACFGPLNKPKVWPIVEKIGGKLHVMDSDPTYLGIGYRDRIFSHEVSGHDGGWREIPTIQGNHQRWW